MTVQVNKAQIIEQWAGKFIPHSVYRRFADLDATAAREFLQGAGFEVVENYDCGYNGWAVTADGYRLSTNGYFHKTKAAEADEAADRNRTGRVCPQHCRCGLRK